MTRINCVHPSKLHTKHLVAEYRELPRVFALVLKAIERGEKPTDPRNPTEYTLGHGHVRFFYPRLGYCAVRFNELVTEMVRRGYQPGHMTIPRIAHRIPPGWWSHWEPDRKAIRINSARIAARKPKD